MGAPAGVVGHRLGRAVSQGQAMAGGQDQKLHPLAPIQKVGQMQRAVALGGAQLACAEHSAEPPPPRPVARQAGDLEPVLQHDPRRRDQPDARPAVARQLSRPGMRPHDPGNGIHIGHRQRGHPQFGGAGHHLLGVGGPGEEGEVRQRGQFHEGHG